MEDEKDAFYVVRKGDVVGIYKSLTDFQAELASSLSAGPSVLVYKGYNLSQEAETHIAACGLKNPTYCISASNVQDHIFDNLLPCPPQLPIPVREEAVTKAFPPKRSQEVLESYKPPKIVSQKAIGSTSIFPNPQRKHMKLDHAVGSVQTPGITSGCQSCMIEFDGASKGNPGLAGAGAILRAVDGSLVCRLKEGLGIATNNVAEYRAAILGMKYALKNGFKHVDIRGDSMLVCMQIEGKWKIKSQNLVILNKEARELKERFLSFDIKQVPREFNSEADALANEAVMLEDGQVQEQYSRK